MADNVTIIKSGTKIMKVGNRVLASIGFNFRNIASYSNLSYGAGFASALDDTNGFLYAFFASAMIYKIDIRTMSVVGTMTTTESVVNSLAYNKKDNTLVACGVYGDNVNDFQTNYFKIYDCDTLDLVGSVNVNSVTTATFDKTCDYLYLTKNQFSQTPGILKFRTSDYTQVNSMLVDVSSPFGGVSISSELCLDHVRNELHYLLGYSQLNGTQTYYKILDADTLVVKRNVSNISKNGDGTFYQCSVFYDYRNDITWLYGGDNPFNDGKKNIYQISNKTNTIIQQMLSANNGLGKMHFSELTGFYYAVSYSGITVYKQ